ncbi:sugar phosphate isomerase/epimerase family protein [Flavitalea sp.]|nr:sugar phosphate isomerase/epimerase [Flavitalea sp.]
MKLVTVLFALIILLNSCTDQQPAGEQQSDSAVAAAVKPAEDWKFGIALWTFHDVNFPESLKLVDSAGLKYIEPNTFHQAGPELKDTLVGKLSPAGLEKLKAMISERGLICESVYVVGDSTIQSWARQFDIAKKLGAKFVTTEPPLNMLNSIDSLAGAYGIMVAIHEHWKGVSQYWNPDTTLLALKDHPNFGVCADLGHFPKSGIDPLEAVKKFKGRIIAIHMKDIAAFNQPALKDVRAGTGVVNFPAIFQELKDQQFKGHIYIERDSIEKPNNLASVKLALQYYNEQTNKIK